MLCVLLDNDIICSVVIVKEITQSLTSQFCKPPLFDVCVCMYVCAYVRTYVRMYVCVCIYIYICIEREREREREREIYIYIYIYMYREIDRCRYNIVLYCSISDDASLHYSIPRDITLHITHYTLYHGIRSISEISSCFFGPRPWHIEIRHRVKKTSTINLFGFETLQLRIRRLKLWKSTVFHDIMCNV